MRDASGRRIRYLGAVRGVSEKVGLYAHNRPTQLTRLSSRALATESVASPLRVLLNVPTSGFITCASVQGCSKGANIGASIITYTILGGSFLIVVI